MLRRFLSHLPLVMFAFAWLMIAFVLGYFTTIKQVFPSTYIDGVFKTIDVVKDHYFSKYSSDYLGPSDVPVSGLAAARMQTLAPGGDENLLLTGGPQRYLEYCPGSGCLAIIVDRQGRLVHAYPFRPELFHQGTIDERPYEQPFMSPERDLNTQGLIALPGGDLIATFYNDKAFPFGGGIARIAPDGRVRWYRHDYTHHWPALLPDGTIATTNTVLETKPVYRPLGAGHLLVSGCKAGWQRDNIQILDTNGKLLQTLPVYDAILNSRWRALLIQTAIPFQKSAESCDPLHTNYVRAVGPEIAAAMGDVRADDLLVSLRNISAIGILDRQTGKFKHLFRGTFFLQHSVQPLGAKILIFDDLGASASSGPSRVLLFDPVTNAETEIFPGPQTPANTPFYTTIAGNIALSADSKRALVAVTESGLTYEIEIATGRVLTRLDNLHDLRPIGLGTPAEADKAGRFKIFGVYYAPGAAN